MKIRLILFSAIAILPVFYIACTKGNFEMDKLHQKVPYDASFAAPLVYGDISLQDALKSAGQSEKFFVNEDGYLSVDYFRKANTHDVNEMLKIEDLKESKSFNYTISSSDFDSEGKLQKEETFTHPFSSFNSESIIDSILLKNGLMDIMVKSTFTNDVKVTLTLPTVIKDGQVFSQEIKLDASETEKSKIDVNCAGYKIDLKTDPSINSLPITLKYEFTTNNQASSTGQIDISFKIKDMKFKKMYGYFGDVNIVERSGQIDIPFFKGGAEGDIEKFSFKNPKLKFNFSNSFGFPVSFHFTELKGKSDFTDNEEHLVSSSFPVGPTSPHIIPAAAHLQDVKEDSVKVDNSNSNIQDFIKARPKSIKYNAKAKIKSNSSPTNRIDFVSDESKIAFKLAIEFPLWGYIHNIRANDTAKFDFNKEIISKSDDRVKRIMLRTDITNGLPIEAVGQIYFADVNNTIIDSVFTNNEKMLESAKVDGNGKVVEAARKVTKIEVTTEKLKKLKDCKNIIFSAVGKTEGSENEKDIKIYPEYRVKFKIGVEFDLEGELKPDMKI